MKGSEESRGLRDAYVDAFNRGALDEIKALLAPEAAYVWVAAARTEAGRDAVMALYRQGHEAFAGKSRLTAVPGTDNQAIWHMPGPDGLKPSGLQTLRFGEDCILEIADEHDPAKVAAALSSNAP